MWRYRYISFMSNVKIEIYILHISSKIYTVYYIPYIETVFLKIVKEPIQYWYFHSESWEDTPTVLQFQCIESLQGRLLSMASVRWSIYFIEVFPVPPGHGPMADLLEGRGGAGLPGHLPGDVDPPDGVAALRRPHAPRAGRLRLVTAAERDDRRLDSWITFSCLFIWNIIMWWFVLVSWPFGPELYDKSNKHTFEITCLWSIKCLKSPFSAL